jgi:hypothetical protein
MQMSFDKKNKIADRSNSEDIVNQFTEIWRDSDTDSVKSTGFCREIDAACSTSSETNI